MDSTREWVSRHWWGGYELKDGEWGLWQIGPLRLWAVLARTELRVETHNAGDPQASDLRIDRPSPAPAGVEGRKIMRFSFRKPPPKLLIAPLLADRSIVSMPDYPFYIPAGEEATLYISSPLWLRLAAGNEPIALAEIPVFRPSDTWFGPSTREGELAYSSHTRARLQLEDVPVRPHRATTPVRIRNRGGDALLLERLSLPVPYLSLYCADNGSLWTQAVTLERHSGGALTELRIDEVPFPGTEGERLAGPRLEAQKSVMVRAFTALFS